MILKRGGKSIPKLEIETLRPAADGVRGWAGRRGFCHMHREPLPAHHVPFATPACHRSRLVADGGCK